MITSVFGNQLMTIRDRTYIATKKINPTTRLFQPSLIVEETSFLARSC